MSWPDGGPWVVATTSSTTSWAVATAALCAVSTARAAVLRIVDDGSDVPPAPLRDNLASYLEIRAGAVDPVRVDDLVGLVGALSRTHGLVLVTGAPGLVVPLGRAGWTLADLARALGAPVVLVADLGPDAANHTTLALDVLAGRDLTGAVVAVGDGDELAGLPVGLAGRIPADAADRAEALRAEALRAAAPGWLDPLLHAGRRPTPAPSGGAPPATPPTDPAERSAAGATSAAGAAPSAGGSGQPPSAGGSAERSAVGAEPSDSGTAAGAGPGSGAGPGRPSRIVAEPMGHRAARTPVRRTVSGKRVLVVLLVVFLASVLLLCGLTLVAPTDPVVTQRITTIQEMPNEAGPTARLPMPVRTSTPARPPSLAACARPAGKVVGTVPDAATTARVDAAWLRIERWLARHAPRSRAGLRPPAAPARIAALQARMSVAFPADLVASLRRHDGADNFDLPPFYRPLRLDQIAADWAVNCKVRVDVSMDDHWWHPSFVPFASAGDGGSLLVDQRPGGHGRVGEFYPEDGTGFDGWPASVTELLVGVAKSLETGEPYSGRYRPTVDAEGRLDWTIG
ncbi:SMI1/KNR4 family protein [Plantactinospora sp. KLBMP9567]|uniref:SMI1/KNR4 family protein n=1 Tax=Plantactinospora sp. KLBMP9567 TaxID=3085900 RepID=UPI00298204E2|nr:SMI1/KNR4 family protein [Plantactinospora sp. KLBMP9567]MDW5329852.1 AAA family ATPase [Plantactinospora sp. KLBMP9567]